MLKKLYRWDVNLYSVYYIKSHNKIYVLFIVSSIFLFFFFFSFLQWHALIIRENVCYIRVCVNKYDMAGLH